MPRSRRRRLCAPTSRAGGGKAIAGYDSPAIYLPSARTQAARRAALPDDATLRADLAAAVAASPFEPDLFEPFARDVAAARAAPPLERSRLAGTAFGLKTDALLVRRDDRWHALLPVRGVADPAALAARIAADGPPGAALLDIRAESTELLASYRERALVLWGVGLAIIVALLAIHLRSALRVRAGPRPDRRRRGGCGRDPPRRRDEAHAVPSRRSAAGRRRGLQLRALLRARAARRGRAAAHRVRGRVLRRDHRARFRLLAWSQVPVLKMIGATAAIGAVASLALATLIARGRG